jgi:hypothetical protein
VEYGTTSAYGTLSTANLSLATSHSVTLTGLTASTTYNYAVMSTNSSGLLSTSANVTFTTAGLVPAPNLGGVAFWSVNGSGVTIAWSTDQAADTAVEYGTTSALGQVSPVQPALTNSHGVNLTGLSSATTYFFRGRSTNSAGAAGYSGIYSFTTLDITPPAIFNIQVAPGNNHTAVISWSTSKPAASQVEFGTNTYYGSWTWATALTQSPRVTLNWVPSGTIHFRLHSTDALGNQGVSQDFTFTEP